MGKDTGLNAVALLLGIAFEGVHGVVDTDLDPKAYTCR